MAKQTLNIIKNWFRTGLKPSQQQFWDTWDSFWHKDAMIPSGNIENLDKRFDEKADAEALNSHMRDLTAHGLGLKAGLGDQNIFTAANTFTHKIRTPEVLTDTGINFNIDLQNKVSARGFAGKIAFGLEDGNISFSSTSGVQDASADPSFIGSQFRVGVKGDTDIAGVLSTAAVSFNTTEDFHQYIRPAKATISADTQLFLPDLSGTLARIEDIPVITAGNNITITGTLLNPVINASGSSNGSATLISVTYNELNVLLNEKNLVPGQLYLLTDFQSTFVYGIHDMNDVDEYLSYGSASYSGDIEPLIIKALKKDRLSAIVKSTVYENDEVCYTIQNLNKGILASTKGTILRRTDKRFNNTANFDYRVTKYITNNGVPKTALNLIRNCKIEINGSYNEVLPLVIGEMSDSEFFSSESNIMMRLTNSKISMVGGAIMSSRVSVNSCEINGSLLLVSKYYSNGLSLNYIYAYTGVSYKYLYDATIVKYLANKSTPSYVAYNEEVFYLQNNVSEGPVTNTILPRHYDS
ncbi:hypothetical protein HDF26_005210 [Pedobacter cryoconitis]|uniref:Uncharacterized protein n=1 Tax=Pedobacter cryoconitis TaxID=188932 RepID=A0A7W8ZMG6_9SPHI|nr:hypothetical protein [Pedobacter cryoconitis]MBB5636734.1 hypothetical protein [Pedobacter cryoconitis]MBB6274728.1 hypothetical protein [Pedobacter cryoconitis]